MTTGGEPEAISEASIDTAYGTSKPTTAIHVAPSATLTRWWQREVHGVTVRITNPTRTVLDCWKYTRRVSHTVALEALRELRASSRHATKTATTV